MSLLTDTLGVVMVVFVGHDFAVLGRAVLEVSRKSSPRTSDAY